MHRDRDALQHLVRVEVDEQAVLEGAGLGLVAVDGEVARTASTTSAGCMDSALRSAW
jgi:hypothetical protein